jgi:hypothetical protein
VSDDARPVGRDRALAARIGAAAAIGLCAGCPAPRAPSLASQIAARTFERGRPDAALVGIAGDAATAFAAFSHAPTRRTAIEAIASATASGADAPPRWLTELEGLGGPLACSGHRVLASIAGTGTTAGITLRGEPGAVVAALDAATGAIDWTLAVDATEWSQIASIATAPDGAVIGGSFAGTLRIADRVVSSAGKADGFVARLTAAGGVAWLIRFGGPGADAVQGVAATGDRIALAGRFAAGAELRGQPLAGFDPRSPYADGVVAELDAAGGLRWAQTFGGEADEAIAGVAIDAAGRLAVAATVRDTVHVAGVDRVASGTADGLVAWWQPGGQPGAAVLLGGSGFDGLRAIVATGDHVVVAGFYAGTLALGRRALTAAGGDDAFLAELDATGRVVASWPIRGDGREEVTALAAIPGGFVAGVAHTAAARIDATALPAPRDPMSGTAIAIRPAR